MKTLVFSGKELFRVLGKGKKNILALEKKLNIKILIDNFGEVKIDGNDPFLEYLCSEMLDALSLGFEINDVLILNDEDYIFRKIYLKNIVRSSRIGAIRGRIIGTGGKAKRIIEELSETRVIVSENIVGIIGLAENVEIANNAINMLISGAPHSTAYRYLEKTRSKGRDSELPLTEIIKDEILNPKKNIKKKKVINKSKSQKKVETKKKPEKIKANKESKNNKKH